MDAMKKWFYERGTELLESPVNKTFDSLLVMSTEEFRQWVVEMRKVVVYLWDEKGQPPRVGYDEAGMIEQFRELEPFIVEADERHKDAGFLKVDECTGEKNVIRNTSNLGGAVNQFFPTMLKTRINYTKDVNAGKSIYDFFAKDSLLDTFVTYATRHFKRDSFYNYSLTLQTSDTTRYGLVPVTTTGLEWLREYENGQYRARGQWDYWIETIAATKSYTGYNEDLRDRKYLQVSKQELENLGDLVPARCTTNINWSKGELCAIRVYETGQKVFPVGLKAFRMSFCQYAVQFPPLTAKLVYEKFTEKWKHEENVFVWDPSAGWAGRLLGALAIEDSRHITYLANDPNTDHTTTPGRTKYHEIYDFYCQHVPKGGIFGAEHTGFKFWQLGSEVMQHDPGFCEYKGKISLVFTSPPYFSKERYSDDPEQSCIKFSNYQDWHDGFLKETLKTAYEWLRPGGFIVLNIADAKFGNEVLPLESDSCRIMENLGFKFVQKYKMALAQTPGGNRLDPITGKPRFQNFAKVDGAWLKVEPFYAYVKPT
jgi:hypothetical protein